jgi:tricorn protease
MVDDTVVDPSPERPMHLRSALALVLLLPLATRRSSPVPRSAEAAPSFAEPAVSPDGREIAFASGGDIWVVPSSGGEARALVSAPSTESRPVWSPDGSRLAFNSTRTGDGDIYVLTLRTGALARLTFADGQDQLDAWSRDGRWIYFTTWVHDLGGGMQDILRVSADGGTPMEVSGDRYMNEYFSAPSPDGHTVAFTGRGSGDWARRGHSHRDESELWLVGTAGAPTYERITVGGAKEQWPMWSADGATIYYVSDRDGAENVWARPRTGRARSLTHFRDGRVLWPSISALGRTIAFERDFAIWTLDTGTGDARPIAITLPQRPESPTVTHLQLDDQMRELALSPDGSRVAFVAHDEVFIASARDSGKAINVSRSPASENQVTWSPDGRRLAYRSDRRGHAAIVVYDVTSAHETQLTAGDAYDQSPRFSPRGDEIAFIRDGRELRAVQLDTRRERLVATGYFSPYVQRPFRYVQLLTWSPDGRWIAFVPPNGPNARNPHVVSATGGVPRALSVLHNFGTSTISWSPDGRFILSDVQMGGDTRRVARIELRRTGDDLSFDRLRQRTSFLPVSVDAAYQTVSPDGKWALVTGQPNLYLVPLEETSSSGATQLTSTGGPKAYAQFAPDGTEVFFLEQGRIRVVRVATREVRSLPVAAELDVEVAQEKLELFNQAWSYIDAVFPDSLHHASGWVAVRARFAPRIAAARASDDAMRLIRLMFGELNASHLAIGSSDGGGPHIGLLGLDFDRAEYERDGRLRVLRVLLSGPADLSSGIHRGDYLLAVDSQMVNSRTNLDSALAGKIGKGVVLRVSTTAGGDAPRDVTVRAISIYAEQTLRLRDWIEDRRALVTKLSGGRLGYVFLRNMTDESMAKLDLDLDEDNRAREGIIVDIRNNFGGVTSGTLVDIISRRDYLTARQRGRPIMSGRATLNDEQMLGLPTVLLTNRQSISDAENFTEGYRALRLGSVVGEPTAGWNIQYGLARLIDGSIMMLPETMPFGVDGVPLEMHPRPVDVFVEQPVGERYSGTDVQLSAAVRTLLQRLGNPRQASR